MMLTLLEMVKGKVQFLYYQDGSLWYRTTPGGFDFPVPIEDTGSARFATEDRAILFMCWIKRHRELILCARKECADGPLCEWCEKVPVPSPAPALLPARCPNCGTFWVEGSAAVVECLTGACAKNGKRVIDVEGK